MLYEVITEEEEEERRRTGKGGVGDVEAAGDGVHDRQRRVEHQRLPLLLHPAPCAMRLLEKTNDPRFTTELAEFNLELNLDPLLV